MQIIDDKSQLENELNGERLSKRELHEVLRVKARQHTELDTKYEVLKS